jgi:hypothetical protein
VARAQLPEYALSVTSRDLLRRRARWRSERTSGRVHKEPSAYKADDDSPESGIVALVDDGGSVRSTTTCDGVQGIATLDDGFLLARHDAIERRDGSLRNRETFATHPCFNDLHSIRRTENGFLVASSGTDGVFEVDTGGALRWQWWATDHGFEADHFGTVRALDKTADHRAIEYDTWLHTTHVNAAAELDADHVLATLFQQGTLAALDRKTGAVTPVMESLSRPHAIRCAGRELTLADSKKGLGITGHVDADLRFTADGVVQVESGWLQDWQHVDDDLYLAVDGEHSRVLFMTSAGKLVREDRFDPNWYLYEAAIYDT